jgi:hypothetical protein
VRGGRDAGRQGTGRAADLIADCLEIYEEGLHRTGSDAPDEEDVAVLLRDQVHAARTHPCTRPPHESRIGVGRRADSSKRC